MPYCSSSQLGFVSGNNISRHSLLPILNENEHFKAMFAAFKDTFSRCNLILFSAWMLKDISFSPNLLQQPSYHTLFFYFPSSRY